MMCCWCLLVLGVFDGCWGINFPVTRRELHGGRRRLKDYAARIEPDGVWYANLHIGSPPQKFTVIVDTGSSTIAVPCQGCSCGPHNHFVMSSSTSASNTGRRYSQCYGEGSCNSGNMVSDVMCLGDTCTIGESTTHTFGCCTTFSPNFKDQVADGIIGLSGSSGTLIAALRSHHQLSTDAFGMCLGKSTGIISVGNIDQSFNFEPFRWAPLHMSGSFYKNNLLAIKLADGTVNVNYGSQVPHVTIDSGTSFTYIPTFIHTKIKQSFQAHCSAHGCSGYHNAPGTNAADLRDSIWCAKLNRNERLADFMKSYPSISFHLEGGVNLCVPPEQYFFVSSLRIYCVGFFRDRDFVFGANLMSHFNVIFDHGHNRIGWARADCEKGTNRPVPCCGKPCVHSLPPTTLSPVTTTYAPVIAAATTTTAAQAATVTTAMPRSQETTAIPSHSSAKATTSAPRTPTPTEPPSSAEVQKNKLHKNELQVLFNEVVDDKTGGLLLTPKLLKYELQNFSLWSVDKMLLGGIMNARMPKKEEFHLCAGENAYCNFAAGSSIQVRAGATVIAHTLDAYKLNVEHSSMFRVADGSTVRLLGPVISNGTVYVSPSASLTFSGTFDQQNNGEFYMGRHASLKSGKGANVHVRNGVFHVLGEISVYCDLVFESAVRVALHPEAILSSYAGIVEFGPGSTLATEFSHESNRFGSIIAPYLHFNGNLDVRVSTDGSTKLPLPLSLVIAKAPNVVGRIQQLSRDSVFECLETNATIAGGNTIVLNFDTSCLENCLNDPKQGKGHNCKNLVAEPWTNEEQTIVIAILGSLGVCICLVFSWWFYGCFCRSRMQIKKQQKYNKVSGDSTSNVFEDDEIEIELTEPEEQANPMRRDLNAEGGSYTDDDAMAI